MVRGIRLTALIGGLLAAQSVSLAANSQTWIEVRTPHFVVVTNGNDHDARRVADQFEMIRGVFRVYFRNASTNDQPVIILAAKDGLTLKPLLPESWTKKGAAPRSGFYLNTPDKSYVGLRLDVTLSESAYEPFEPIYHEYVHYLMRRMSPRLPTWMVEGLAEFYANLRIESKKVLVGTPSKSNLMILREKTLLPLTTLFQVNGSSPYYNEENKISIFYAESWALTHYLMARDWDENTNRVGDFFALLGQNVPQDEAARRTIGDPTSLQGPLNEYIHLFSFKAARLDRPKTEQADYLVRTLSEAESLAVRADFMAHQEPYVKAQAMLEEAIELDPKLAVAYEDMGYLYFRQDKKADAEKWLAKAVALNPQSSLANYYYAATLLRNILPHDETVATADASLRAAIKSNPGFAPAYDALAYCLARPGAHRNLDEAYRFAQMAQQEDPSNVGYRIRAVEVLEAMGHAEDAINEATLAVSMARSSADRTAAAGALEAARKFQVAQKKDLQAKTTETPTAPTVDTINPKVVESPPQGAPGSGIEVLSDTMGVDFGPYLKPIMKTVNDNWHSLLPASVYPPLRKSGTVTIEFAILKDGTILGMKLARSSGDPPLDRACWASVTNSAPLPPLPKEFSGQYLQLRFMFCYNDACKKTPASAH